MHPRDADTPVLPEDETQRISGLNSSTLRRDASCTARQLHSPYTCSPKLWVAFHTSNCNSSTPYTRVLGVAPPPLLIGSSTATLNTRYILN